ncbi:MAG: Cdc6/Cdc18 family protein [Candidatus Helarchaeota archaeon]
MDNIVERNLMGSSIFKDESTLFREYVPNKLPRREKEIARLARDFKPLTSKEGAFSVNVAIIGNAGIGKTSIAKYFQERFPKSALKLGKKIYCIYYNCYTYRTKSSILRHLLNKYFNVFSTRGFSDNELLSDLMKKLQREDANLILILDEANVLGSDDILSFIYIPEAFDFGKSRISTILISRLTEFNSLLNVQLSERIHDKIQLAGYTAEDLNEILGYRVELAFRENVVTPEVFDQVVEISAGSQNARHGIEIFYHAGKIADQERKTQITPEMVRQAKAHVYPELRSSVLEDLKIHELYVSIAIARNLKHENKTNTTIDEIYNYYKIVCEENEEIPQAKVTFRRHVNVLAQTGVIYKVIQPVSEGKRGRRSVITLQDIPAEVLEEKCMILIEKIKKEL